jgi:GTPase SAR1 family protein
VKELQTQGAAKMIIALVGNKSDLEDARRIKKEVKQTERTIKKRKELTSVCVGSASVCGREWSTLHGNLC